jgi:hypothetical protein
LHPARADGRTRADRGRPPHETLVVALWIALLIPRFGLGQKLGDVTDRRTETFLAHDAASTAALPPQKERVEGGETVTGLTGYRRASCAEAPWSRSPSGGKLARSAPQLAF